MEGRSSAAPVVVEFSVPSDRFLLWKTVPVFPEVLVEGEWLIPTDDGVCPYLWVTGPSLDEFERRGRADPTVGGMELEAKVSGGGLYAVEWDSMEGTFVESVVETSGVVLECQANADYWTVKMRFPDRSDTSALREASARHDVPLRVKRVYDLSAPKIGQYDVTPKQREMLVLALERGYFEMPREVTMEELAEEMGISTGAASERFRRGLTNLVSSTLTIGRPAAVGVRE